MTTGYGAAALAPEDGWTEAIDDGFIALIGPFYTRTDGDHTEVTVVCQDKHRNRRGIVQGGLVTTFADRALGIAARAHSGAPTTATVHLDTHFVAPIHVGDVLRARPPRIGCLHRVPEQLTGIADSSANSRRDNTATFWGRCGIGHLAPGWCRRRSGRP